MTPEQIERHLLRANAVAQRAIGLGKHPFGAILVAPDGETVLAEQGNVDTVNHAESALARTAATNFTPEYLWGCTLVTTVEPCAMCAGTQYWANIGTLVFGLTERRLLELTGNHAENPTMDRAGCWPKTGAGDRPGACGRRGHCRLAPELLEALRPTPRQTNPLWCGTPS